MTETEPDFRSWLTIIFALIVPDFRGWPGVISRKDQSVNAQYISRQDSAQSSLESLYPFFDARDHAVLNQLKVMIHIRSRPYDDMIYDHLLWETTDLDALGERVM